MRVKSLILAATACALLSAIPLTAADEAAAKTSKKTTAAIVKRSAWGPETLTGKIAKVDPGKKLVVVDTPGGVPFDLVVTRRTKIESGNQAITLEDLTRDMNKNVSVQFTPERRGDVAKSIQLGG